MDHLISDSLRLKRYALIAFALALVIASPARAAEPVYTEAELDQITPMSANPYLAFLPANVTPDYDYWDSKLYWSARNAAETSIEPKIHGIIAVIEAESLFNNPNDPGFVDNNSIDMAQHIPELGTVESASVSDHVQISATFRPGTFIATLPVEDDGSMVGVSGINAARPTETGVIAGFITSAFATIGDGPHGSTGTGMGDIDYYSTGHLVAGVTLSIDIDTLFGGSSGSLDTFVVLRDRFGRLVDFNDDDVRPGMFSGDSYLSFFVEQPGQYFISVNAYKPGLGNLSIPIDPYESGTFGGYETGGDYAITIRVSDLDYYSIDLQEGDVLSFGSASAFSSVDNATLMTPGGSTVLWTNQNGSFLYPEDHPFRTSAKVHGAVVAPASGTYPLLLTGNEASEYMVDLKIRRPELENAAQNQILYLTMWGVARDIYGGIAEHAFASIPFNPADYAIFDPPEYPDIDDFFISPLVAWYEQLITLGEDGADIDERDRIFRTVSAPRILSFVQARMPDVDVRLGPPPSPITPDSNFSEIKIGGSIEEVQIATIGLADAIDVGNFDQARDAFVLMDIMTPGIATTEYTWPPSSDDDIDDANANQAFLEMYATILSAVIVHEAGHFFGNFHTNNANSANNTMDTGGSATLFEDLAGSGPDEIHNSVDDIPSALGVDEYDPFEGFRGMEDTDKTLRYGTGSEIPVVIDLSNLYVNLNSFSEGVGTETQPFNILESAVNIVNPGGTVHIAPSSGDEIFVKGNLIDTPMTIVNSNPLVGVIQLGKKSTYMLERKKP